MIRRRSRGHALGSWINNGLLDQVQRPLCEGRERADRLDRVSEELDANRLSTRGGKDVDQPAPDRELAAFLGPLSPLVTGCC
jgi:hypothetical protein